MVKRLTRHGNSYALIIDKPILDLLNITPESALEITTDGRVLTVTPAGSRAQRVSSSLAKLNARHHAALKRLAE